MNFQILHENEKEFKITVEFYNYEKVEKAKNAKPQKFKNYKGKNDENTNVRNQGNFNFLRNIIYNIKYKI